MLKIYVNKYNLTSGRAGSNRDYVLVSDIEPDIDSNTLMACSIKSMGSLGFGRWALSNFMELGKGEEVSIDLNITRSKLLAGNKIYVERLGPERSNCIIDLNNGKLIYENLDNYLNDNMVKFKFKINSKSKFNFFKIPLESGSISHRSDSDILISDGFGLDNRIKGCMIRGFKNRFVDYGYSDQWGHRYFEKVDEGTHEMTIHPLDLEVVKNNKILVKGVDGKLLDCVIHIDSGEIESINIDGYKKKNPHLIKLKRHD